MLSKKLLLTTCCFALSLTACDNGGPKAKPKAAPAPAADSQKTSGDNKPADVATNNTGDLNNPTLMANKAAADKAKAEADAKEAAKNLQAKTQTSQTTTTGAAKTGSSTTTTTSTNPSGTSTTSTTSTNTNTGTSKPDSAGEGLTTNGTTQKSDTDLSKVDKDKSKSPVTIKVKADGEGDEKDSKDKAKKSDEKMGVVTTISIKDWANSKQMDELAKAIENAKANLSAEEKQKAETVLARISKLKELASGTMEAKDSKSTEAKDKKTTDVKDSKSSDKKEEAKSAKKDEAQSNEIFKTPDQKLHLAIRNLASSVFALANEIHKSAESASGTAKDNLKKILSSKDAVTRLLFQLPARPAMIALLSDSKLFDVNSEQAKVADFEKHRKSVADYGSQTAIQLILSPTWSQDGKNMKTELVKALKVYQTDILKIRDNAKDSKELSVAIGKKINAIKWINAAIKLIDDNKGDTQAVYSKK